ncbi:hypothetical protein [Sphingomonas changbaiensis]|nr:hypothetical protein [Sphingomonas changbaiensis]
MIVVAIRAPLIVASFQGFGGDGKAHEKGRGLSGRALHRKSTINGSA